MGRWVDEYAQTMSGSSYVAGGAATTGTGRVGNLDVLRAIAALAVVVGHAYALGGRSLPVRAEHWYDVLLLQTATGVWLFFGISGYVISKPFVDALVVNRPLPQLVPYALKRGFRIFPLYWLALVVVLLAVGAGSTKAWHYPAHFALVHNLVPGRQAAILSVAWTLTLEVLFYVAIPVLAFAARRTGTTTAERLAGFVAVTWLLSILLTVGADLYRADRIGIWLRQSFPAMWQMFCPGILLAIAPHLRSARWRRWLVELPTARWSWLIAAFALLVAAVLNSLAPLGHGLETFQVVYDASRPLFAIGYGLVLATAIAARPWCRERARFMLRLGLVSYGIYLLHAVILYVLLTPRGRRLLPLQDAGALPFVFHLLLLLGLTIPLAMASWRWFEQPCIRLGSSLARRWRERSDPRTDGSVVIVADVAAG